LVSSPKQPERLGEEEKMVWGKIKKKWEKYKEKRKKKKEFKEKEKNVFEDVYQKERLKLIKVKAKQKARKDVLGFPSSKKSSKSFLSVLAEIGEKTLASPNLSHKRTRRKTGKSKKKRKTKRKAKTTGLSPFTPLPNPF